MGNAFSKKGKKPKPSSTTPPPPPPPASEPPKSEEKPEVDSAPVSSSPPPPSPPPPSPPPRGVPPPENIDELPYYRELYNGGSVDAMVDVDVAFLGRVVEEGFLNGAPAPGYSANPEMVSLLQPGEEVAVDHILFRRKLFVRSSEGGRTIFIVDPKTAEVTRKIEMKNLFKVVVCSDAVDVDGNAGASIYGGCVLFDVREKDTEDSVSYHVLVRVNSVEGNFPETENAADLVKWLLEKGEKLHRTERFEGHVNTAFEASLLSHAIDVAVVDEMLLSEVTPEEVGLEDVLPEIAVELASQRTVPHVESSGGLSVEPVQRSPPMPPASFQLDATEPMMVPSKKPSFQRFVSHALSAQKIQRVGGSRVNQPVSPQGAAGSPSKTRRPVAVVTLNVSKPHFEQDLSLAVKEQMKCYMDRRGASPPRGLHPSALSVA